MKLDNTKKKIAFGITALILFAVLSVFAIPNLFYLVNYYQIPEKTEKLSNNKYMAIMPGNFEKYGFCATTLMSLESFQLPILKTKLIIDGEFVPLWEIQYQREDLDMLSYIKTADVFCTHPELDTGDHTLLIITLKNFTDAYSREITFTVTEEGYIESKD